LSNRFPTLTRLHLTYGRSGRARDSVEAETRQKRIQGGNNLLATEGRPSDTHIFEIQAAGGEPRKHVALATEQ